MSTLISPSTESSANDVHPHPQDLSSAAPSECHREQSGRGKYRRRRSGRHRSSIIAEKDAASKAAAADTLRAVAKAAEMDADAQYASAVIIRAESEAATDRKGKVALTKTSTNLFRDVEAIGRYVDATNATADALVIKSDRIRVVAAKLRVAEKVAPLPLILAQHATDKNDKVAPTKITPDRFDDVDVIKSTLIAKPRNPSAIIDGWRLTRDNSIDGFIIGSKTHSDGHFTSSSINSSPSAGSIVTTMSGSIYLLGNRASSIDNKSSTYSRPQLSKLYEYLKRIRRWKIKFSDFGEIQRTRKYKAELRELDIHDVYSRWPKIS